MQHIGVPEQCKKIGTSPNPGIVERKLDLLEGMAIEKQDIFKKF